MVGGDVYWAGAEAEVRAFAEAARIPVFANDMGRGVVPADHELAFARARATAFKGTDLVLVAGTPLDFRLGFGVVRCTRRPPGRQRRRARASRRARRLDGR